MRKKAEEILVIGACRMDYLSRSDEAFKDGKENAGTLFATAGGTGRNVSENLARLNNKVSFITVIGEDHMGLSLKTALSSTGVSVYSISTKFPTGIYNSISDIDGTKKAFIEDTRGIDSLKPKDLKTVDAIIKSHDHIVLEGNLNDKIIDYLFKTYKDKHFYVDGVSPMKSVRFRKHLADITLFKSNVSEASALLEQEAEPEDLAKAILKQGCQYVVLSHTQQPIFYGEKGQTQREPIVVRKDEVRSNGVGDALFAGLVHCLVHNMPLKQSVKFALSMTYRTLGVDTAVDPNLDDIL